MVLDGQSLAEGTEIAGERVAHALRADLPVTTSRPAPQEFADHVGTPLTDGLMTVHNALVGCGLRDRIRIGDSSFTFER